MPHAEALAGESDVWTCRGWSFNSAQWEHIRGSTLEDISGLQSNDDMTRPFGELEREMLEAMCFALCPLPWWEDTALWRVVLPDRMTEHFYSPFPSEMDHSLGCLLASYRRVFAVPADGVFSRVEACLFRDRAEEANVRGCCENPRCIYILEAANVAATQAPGLFCVYTYVTALLVAAAVDDAVLLEHVKSRFDRLWERVHHLLLTGFDEPRRAA